MSTTFAFFDFDETVYRYKSMFEFARYYLEAIDELHGHVRFGLLMERVHDLVAEGKSRSEVNRFYYSQYAGASQADVAQYAEDWYSELKQSALPYLIEPVVKRIEEFKERGATLALVSGAFAPILRPFARELGINELICTEAEVVDGRYTGGIVSEPVIGDEKAVRIARLLRERNLDAEDCCAFGDHVSDLPMLNLVGHATVVNPSVEMAKVAEARGWDVLRG